MAPRGVNSASVKTGCLQARRLRPGFRSKRVLAGAPPLARRLFEAVKTFDTTNHRVVCVCVFFMDSFSGG